MIWFMLMPSKTKFRKLQKGRRGGKALSGNALSFGDIGLQALEAGWVSSKQIEAGRVALTRFVKKGGKLWIRIFPDKPLTKKPAETRMGKGKGNPEEWVAVVKPGRVLYELQGISQDEALEAMGIASHKLPVATRVLRRDQLLG